VQRVKVSAGDKCEGGVTLLRRRAIMNTDASEQIERLTPAEVGLSVSV